MWYACCWILWSANKCLSFLCGSFISEWTYGSYERWYIAKQRNVKVSRRRLWYCSMRNCSVNIRSIKRFLIDCYQTKLFSVLYKRSFNLYAHLNIFNNVYRLRETIYSTYLFTFWFFIVHARTGFWNIYKLKSSFVMLEYTQIFTHIQFWRRIKWTHPTNSTSLQWKPHWLISQNLCIANQPYILNIHHSYQKEL